jgi:hypothetical protein
MKRTDERTEIVDQVGNREQAIMNVELKGANMHAQMICMIGVVILEGCVQVAIG